MSGTPAPSAPGTDRPLSPYNLKRIIFAPRVWRGRRRARDEVPSAQAFLEQHRYAPAAYEIMASKAIDPHLLHRADIGADSVVWEVGAARGDGVADLRELSGGIVHAFEPHPGSIAHLEERFAGDDRVHVQPYALGRSDGTDVLELAGPGSSATGDRRGDFPTAEISFRDVVAVFDELGTARVDLMEINIEGGEYDLLEGLLAAGLTPKVRYFLIQFHEWHPRSHSRRRRILRALAATHEEVWCYPWIWELWCLRDDPHPAPPELTPELQAAVIAEVRARQAAAGRG